jgi:hypothetical protein
MSIHIQSEIPDDIEKDDPVHLVDLCTVLLEENWVTVPTSPSPSDDMAFRKNGTDYDNIIVKEVGRDRSFWVTVPLPSSPGAYRTRVATALDVYIYVTAFIEYYAEMTLSVQYKTQISTNTRRTRRVG